MLGESGFVPRHSLCLFAQLHKQYGTPHYTTLRRYKTLASCFLCSPCCIRDNATEVKCDKLFVYWAVQRNHCSIDMQMFFHMNGMLGFVCVVTAGSMFCRLCWRYSLEHVLIQRNCLCHSGYLDYSCVSLETRLHYIYQGICVMFSLGMHTHR